MGITEGDVFWEGRNGAGSNTGKADHRTGSQEKPFRPLSDGAGRNGNAYDPGSPDDIPAGSEGEKAGRNGNDPSAKRWLAVPLSALNAQDLTTAWSLYGFIGPQLIMLFTGLWKAGKTTFLAHLLRAFGDGCSSFISLEVTPLRVLVISEEAERLWVERRDSLGIGDHVSVICKPFLKAPSMREWVEFLTLVALQVEEDAFGLVVFDTIFSLWPVRDENNAAEVKEALMPLNMVIKAGAGIILGAHPKKGDAGQGQATRGTGALPGYVDVICELRRYDPERAGDTRRVLTTYSRFEETPAELVIELDKDTSQYRAAGTKAEIKSKDRISVVLELLPEPPTAYTAEEVLQHWPADEVRPGVRTIRRDLEEAVKNGEIGMRGEGARNDPRRFFRRPE